jgi:hypothetical protein
MGMSISVVLRPLGEGWAALFEHVRTWPRLVAGAFSGERKNFGKSREGSGLTLADSALMIHMTDYRQRADECRRLADLRAGTEHWAAFLEMAETWEKLASLHEYTQQLKSSGVLLQAPARTYSDKAFSSSANGHSA